MLSEPWIAYFVGVGLGWISAAALALLVFIAARDVNCYKPSCNPGPPPSQNSDQKRIDG